MFGQVGFFYKFEGKDWEDKRPLQRYVAEARKVLEVLNARLETREWMMGREYSIADIATFPPIRNLIHFYGAGDLVGTDDFPHVTRALDAFLGRPAVIRGLEIPKMPA
jgi:GST-like protein